jgi:hypothetical protein
VQELHHLSNFGNKTHDMIGCFGDVNESLFHYLCNPKEIVVNTLDSHKNVEEMQSSRITTWIIELDT